MTTHQIKSKFAWLKKSWLLAAFILAGASALQAQKLDPILIQRETKLSPVLREKLANNRTILAARKVKFIIGATEASEKPVASLTGAFKPNISAAMLKSQIGKVYNINILATVNTKVYDMRAKKLVTPIRNQAHCGSCWDFAIIACAETNYLFRNPTTDPNSTNIDLSEQQVICNGNAGDCRGGNSSTAAKWMYDNKVKILTEGALGYNSSLPNWGSEAASCPKPTVAGKYKVVDYGVLPIPAGQNYPAVNTIKQAILDHGAVTASFWADSLVFAQIISYYGGGPYEAQAPLYTPPNYTPKPCGHEIAIVGWDDNVGCWIIKNSWGPYWGDHGYGLWKYGAHNIGTDATWVEVEKLNEMLIPKNTNIDLTPKVKVPVVKPAINTPIRKQN